MERNNKIIDFIHDFFLIKRYEHIKEHGVIIEEFINKPGLSEIAKKYDTSIGEIHQIVREYKLNELNCSVFKILTERV